MAFFGLGARLTEKVSQSRFNMSDQEVEPFAAKLEKDTEALTSDTETDSQASSEFDDSNATSYLSMLSNLIFAGLERKPSFIQGTDSWLPPDLESIVEVPESVLPRYKKIYPISGGDISRNGSFTVITTTDSFIQLNRPTSPLTPTPSPTGSDPSLFSGEFSPSASCDNIEGEVLSPAPAADPANTVGDPPGRTSPSATNNFKPPLHHLVISFWKESKERKHVLSLYRSRQVTDAIALCERCRECSELFRLNPKNIQKKEYLSNLLTALRDHLLWKPAHIAAYMGILEYFKQCRKIQSVVHILSQPEGMTPLMIAVQYDRLAVVAFLITLGGDMLTALGSSFHNNILHYAAYASADMVKVLMDTGKCADMLNVANSENCTPLYMALMGANPYCAKALKSYGASLYAASSNRISTPLMDAMKKNKMDATSMQSIFEASPDALKEVDPVTGNGVLHSALYKKPLLALLELKSDELFLDVRNSLMQTPLHLYVQRNDLSLVMALVAYNVDLNAKDNNGNTPLHLAVSNLNLEIVRLLLCVGAEPNIVNNHKETPRHLAAKFKSRYLKCPANNDVARDIVHSLVICGAKTCPTGFVGCTVSCVHKDNFVGEPVLKTVPSNSSGVNDESRTENENVASARVDPGAATGSYEYELDPDSHTLDEAYCSPNPVRNFPQQNAVERILAMLRDFAEKKKSDPNLISVLSLDGGGIKGLVIVQILIALQKQFNTPLVNYFDWIAGTSTGSFVASSLVSGKSFREMQKMYLRFKDILFDSWSRPYNTTVLEGFLKKSFGADLKMSDVKYPRMFFTTVRADTFPAQLELVRNYLLPLTMEENEELGFTNPEDTLIWRAARRSSAAPTYFSASEGKFIDGGMVANNPTLDLLSEIHFWNSTCQYKNSSLTVDVGCVVSIGTGITPVSPVDPSLFEMSDMFGMLRGIKNLSLMVLDQVTATEGAPIARSRSWCHSLGIPYFRLNAPLFKDIVLDSKEDTDLVKMMWDVIVYAHTHRKDFEDLAVLLKAIGTNKLRKKRI